MPIRKESRRASTKFGCDLVIPQQRINCASNTFSEAKPLFRAQASVHERERAVGVRQRVLAECISWITTLREAFPETSALSYTNINQDQSRNPSSCKQKYTTGARCEQRSTSKRLDKEIG